MFLMQFVILNQNGSIIVSYPQLSHMLKSQLINISVSAEHPPSDNSYAEQAAEQPRGEIVDFSHGGENDLRRARIPLGNGVA